MQSPQIVPDDLTDLSHHVEHIVHFFNHVQRVSALAFDPIADFLCDLNICFDYVYFRYVAVGAIVGGLMLYSCSSSLYNSLIVCFCDRETLQRSFFVSTILSNAFSCLLLLAIALALGGHSPTIGFTRETYIFSAILSLAFAYPLWLHVPEPEGDTLTEPITPSNTVTAVINGAQALAKNRYLSCPLSIINFLLDGIVNRFISGSSLNLRQPASFFRMA